MAFLTLWIMCVVVTAALAERKHKNQLSWGALALCLGPLAVLAIIVRKAAPPPLPWTPPSTDTIGIELRVGDVIEGLRAHIDIRTDGIAIRRDAGGRNLILHGLKGEKRIPYRSITAVQLKVPDQLTSGYIQFSVLGGLESSRGIYDAAKDENSVLFLPDQTQRMVALRDLVERNAGRSASVERPNGLASELSKLADMRSAGTLTDAEFSAAKVALLGNRGNS